MMGMRSRAIVALSILAVTPALGWAQSGSPPKVPAAPVISPCESFFQLLAYTDMPDLKKKYGIAPARVFGAQDFWPKGDPRETVPSEPGVAKGLDLRPPNGGPIVLDIEHWPQRGTQAEVTSTVDRLLGLLATVRRIEPGVNIGYYGIPPIRDYWRAIRGPGDAQYEEWVRDNDRLARLAQSVNVLFPSLYTFYDDPAGWRKYAVANLKEARRLAGSKRIYAFLWPQYHESNKQLGGQYVAASYWRSQLETVAEHADGVLLWGGWASPGIRAKWDESAGWWVETKRFIETRNAGPCRQPG